MKKFEEMDIQEIFEAIAEDFPLCYEALNLELCLRYGIGLPFRKADFLVFFECQAPSFWESVKAYELNLHRLQTGFSTL